MRKSDQNIMHSFTHHKPAVPTALALAFVMILSILICGCGNKGDTPDQATTSSSGELTAIRTSTSTSELDFWVSLIEHLQRDDRVLESDYSRLLSLPAYALIKDNSSSKLNPIILQNVMSYAVSPRDEYGRATGRRPKRQDLAVNYVYCTDHLEQLKAFSADMKNRDLGVETLTLVDGFLSPRQLPDQLVFSFVVSNNSITFAEPDIFVIDASLAIASESRMLDHIVAASIYRQFSGMSENNPKNAPAGAETISRTMRKLRQEGIAAWIENLPEIKFDQDHETLAKSNRHRTDVLFTADKYLGSFYDLLTEVLDPDKNLMQGNSTIPHDHLSFNKVYPQVGYAMAALIADRYGEDRLKAVSGSTLDFLDAYQQAASNNTSPYELGDLDPFPDRTYQRLIALISQ